MPIGPCAKTQVTFNLHTKGGEVFVGRNDCANPQPACPRAPGEGYEKCVSICQQAGHAEIMAIRAATAAGADLEGSKGNLYGINRFCDPCRDALHSAGMKLATIYPDAAMVPAITKGQQA